MKKEEKGELDLEKEKIALKGEEKKRNRLEKGERLEKKRKTSKKEEKYK